MYSLNSILPEPEILNKAKIAGREQPKGYEIFNQDGKWLGSCGERALFPTAAEIVSWFRNEESVLNFHAINGSYFDWNFGSKFILKIPFLCDKVQGLQPFFIMSIGYDGQSGVRIGTSYENMYCTMYNAYEEKRFKLTARSFKRLDEEFSEIVDDALNSVESFDEYTNSILKTRITDELKDEFIKHLRISNKNGRSERIIQIQDYFTSELRMEQNVWRLMYACGRYLKEEVAKNPNDLYVSNYLQGVQKNLFKFYLSLKRKWK